MPQLALNFGSVVGFPTGKLAGRSTAAAGKLEALTVGAGLSLAAGTLTAAVTSVAGRTGAVTLTNADVGLGNVENTALSTWAGSANLTTLGTISSIAGNFSASNHLINNLLDPVSAQDAATKNYVDATAQNLDAKASCRVATTANITLSGTQTIDGIAVIAGDRVLVKNQTTASGNGIYVVAAGAWSRSTDANTNTDFTTGAFAFIEQGTVNGSTGWVLTTAEPLTIGATSLTFTQFSGAGTYTAGSGLTLTGTQFSIGAGQVANSMLANAAVANLSGTNTGDQTLPTGANPTASVGLAAVNGSAATFLRSDGAPALDVTIAPSWTGMHTFLKAGIGAVSTDSATLSNTTAAAAGAQQWSPRLHWIGQGWKTNAAAASQTVEAICELQPVQGAASPTANLVWSTQVNGGGYTAQMTLNTSGQVLLPIGASTAPSFSYASFPAEGFYRDATCNGTTVMVSSAYKGSSWNFAFGTKLAKDQFFGWSNATGDSTSATTYVVLRTTASNTLNFSSDGSTGVANLALTGIVNKYNNITTAGVGVPTIVASARSTAQSAAVASVAAYTLPAADGSYEVAANVLVTTATTHAFTVTCAYTDEGNTARTITLPFVLVAGSAIVNSVANANGAVPYHGIPLKIRCKASTTITIATTGTFTTVTYNVEGIIKQTA